MSDPTPPAPHGFRALLGSDYRRLYDGREETDSERRRRAPVRFLTNPSLHAVFLIRAALASPAALFGPWRHVLLAKHSIDLERDCELGPKLNLPHPFGILLAGGTMVGEDVTLYHNVTIGGTGSGPGPALGDGVVVHTNSVIADGASVGAGAVIGASSFVEGEVPAGAVFVRDRIVRGAGAQPAAEHV
jgi:serine acetyltransferase